MGLKMAGFILPLLLFVPVIGTDLSRNDTLFEDVRVPRSSKRVVRLYSGTRPKPIVCLGEGFQADPSDCSIFHRCMKTGNGRYVSFRFQCGPGTIYDTEKEICSHLQNTRRTECGATIQVPRVEGNFDNDISRELPSPLAFINQDVSETSKKRDFFTQTTKHFDVPRLASKYPWVISQQQNSDISTLNPFINRPQQTKSPKASSVKREIAFSDSTTPWSIPSTTANIVFQNPASNLPGDICKFNGFIGDNDNCRKFYRCISNQRGGFIRYEFECSDPTVWDDEKQACNHEWAVKRSRCSRRSFMDDIDTRLNKQETVPENTSTSKTTNLPSQSQLQINYGSKVSQSQLQISNGSAVQNQTQINYGVNKNDGSSLLQNQTQISSGDAVSQTQTQINYGYQTVQTQLQIDHSKDSSQSHTQVNQPSSTTKTTQYNQHQSMSTTSSNGCTESGFLGDPEDCKKFYRCVDNGRGGFIRYEFSCGEGTVWDPKIEACNHAWAVKECGGKGPSEVTTQSTTRGPEDPSILSTSRTTTTTTTTSTTSEGYQSSEEPGYEDNDIFYGNQPSSSTTNKPIEQTAPENKEPQNPSDNTCTSSGFMGDIKDCKRFYRCVDNANGGYTRYEFSCGEGTVWDQKIEACNHDWAVENCGNNASVEGHTEKSTTTNVVATSTQTSSQPSQNDDYDTGYGQPVHDEPKSTIKTSTVQSTTTYQPNQQSNSSESNVGNVCTSSGFMGDNNDCKKFYRCVDNGNGGYTKYEFSCGEGTVWDNTIQACNHAWAVEKCGGNTVEDINQVKTTTRKETETSSSSTTPISEPDDDNDVGYGQPSQETQSTSSTTRRPENQNPETNQCQTIGFMGDTNDCKKFYRCVDNGDGTFTRYEFSCGEGTVWDSKIDACNHAWAVEKCGGTSSSPPNESNSSNNPIENDEYPKETTASSTTASLATSTAPASSSTTSSTTASSQSNDNICKTSGFMGDSQDCKKFYRCVEDGRGGYIRYEFACGEGTVWDQSKEACNHRWAVSGPCSSSESYSDSNNVQLTTQSAASSAQTEEDQGGYNESTTQKTSTSTSQLPQSSDSQCSQEGFYGDLNDCKKFYRCVDNSNGGYTKYDFTCGDGTVWDQEILACNHENGNSKCSSNAANPTTTSSTTTTSSPDTGSSSLSTAQQSQTTQKPSSTTGTSTIGIGGDDKCSSEGFYANTKDCSKFYRCVDNGKGGFTKYDFDCGEGTVWVQEIQACDYDNGISGCSNTESSTKPETVVQQQSTTSSSTSSQMTTESQGPNKDEDEYPSESSSKIPESDDTCTSEGFFGNKNDCTRFYRCVDNGQGGYTKYDFTCGEGTAWDSNIQTCNHKSEVESCQNTNEQSQSEKPNEEQGSQSNPNQEQGSTQTTESTSTTKEADAGNNSKPTSTSNDICEEEGYFGNTQDCTKFYRCVDNGKGGYTKYDFDCGEGTIWDQDVTTCNHPENVNSPSCKKSEDGQYSQQSSTESSASSSSSTESSNQSSSNCTQETTSKKPANDKVKCEKAGFFADPDDCKKFYRCVDWDGDGKRFSIYHFDCGEGTIWDPQLETCNHEDSVYPQRDCSGSQSQTGPQESTSTTTEKSTTTAQFTTESTTTTQSTTESTTTTQFTAEETTIQQSTSSEQTTHQATTTEKSTTQQSSTTESTTTTTQPSTSTKQTTTSEKTTTQSSTTKPTTTEQTTTSQQQTTQETATSQQTTTEQTTTSEQTTTEQTTTSEQTTTQQSTTSEQTTHQMTTSEQTTQSSEQTTTQQSSTTDSTTETTTEQHAATAEQSSTTEQSSEQNTTEQQMTTESTTTTSEGTTESSPGTTSQETSSQKDCPETEEDQYMYVCPSSFRRHPKYCNMFYQCTEDSESHDVKVAMFKCPNNTIYDESQNQCVSEDKADEKCDGETAQRHRVKRKNSNFKEPIEASRGKHSCPTAGFFPYEIDNECSGIFLKCQTSITGKLRGYVYRCPEGYTFWSISKRCEKKDYMNGCKYADRSWRDRWEIPVEKRNIAIVIDERMKKS